MSVIMALLGGGMVIALMYYDYSHTVPPKQNRRSTDKHSTL